MVWGDDSGGAVSDAWGVTAAGEVVAWAGVGEEVGGLIGTLVALGVKGRAIGSLVGGLISEEVVAVAVAVDRDGVELVLSGGKTCFPVTSR